jgi:Ion channel
MAVLEGKLASSRRIYCLSSYFICSVLQSKKYENMKKTELKQVNFYAKNIPVYVCSALLVLGSALTVLEYLRLATTSYAFAVVPLLLLAAFHYTEFRKWVALLCLGITMILLILSFSFIYAHYGLIGPDGHTDRNHSTALYFSVVTWTTLGYGDFRPTPDARLWAAAEALLGYFISALFIAFLLKNREPRLKEIH